MSFSGSKLRQAAERRERQTKNQRAVSFITGMAVVIILIVVLWSSGLAASQPVDHTVDYDPSLVIYDRPMEAIHNMNSEVAPSSNLVAEGPQPKVTSDLDFFDFKQVGATEVVEHEFVVKNEGDATLVISGAFTTCACTTASFTGTIIPPGKIAVITLTFDAGYHDARGQTVRRGLIFQTNDPAKPQIEIWTQAAVAMTP